MTAEIFLFINVICGKNVQVTAQLLVLLQE